MSKYYNIYVDIITPTFLVNDLRHIKYWIGPCISEKCSITVWNREDVDKVLNILADKGYKVYQHVRHGLNSYEYREVDISKYKTR